MKGIYIYERERKRERVVKEKFVALRGLERNDQWVMKRGLSRVIDHVLESLEFG